MPDEQTGTPATETSASTETEATPTVGIPGSSVAPETPPISDPRYAGKSQAELVDIIYEKEKMAGREGETRGKVAQLEQALGNLQDYISRLEGTRQERQQEPTQDEFDLTNPAKSVREIVARERQQIYQDFGRYRQKETYDEAVANFTAGRRSAMAGNKELFDGIENEVSNSLWEAVKANPGTRHSLRDPSIWEKAAQIVRLDRGEYDKIMPRKQSVMAPPKSELPGRTTRQLLDDDEVALTDEDRAQAEADNMTEKEALEAKKVGLDMYRRGKIQGSVGRR